MKHIILFGIAIIMPVINAMADQPLFQYPQAPESLETMEEKCSYVIEHFWDRCNINQAFSYKGKLQQAFNDYIQIIPYANADIVHTSVDKLIDRVNKNPQQLLFLAEMAEGMMYCDTARIVCDEVYYPFAKAVANHKKIKQADKARFILHEKILGGSQVGMTAPDFTYTDTLGTKHQFNDIPAGYVILFFDNPNSSDCMMTRVRLAADYNINEFIKRGQLNVVCIYPEEYDSTWKDIAKRLPGNWHVGVSLEVNKLYDMRHEPVIYYLNSRHKILSKSMTADQLLNAFRTINTKASTD